MISKRTVLLLSLPILAALPAAAQQNPAPPSSPAAPVKSTQRGDAYYNFAIGHLYELQYEQTSQPDFASKAIEAYKKAYAIDPQSPIIGERLAEMYWKAQRVREAVSEANEILKRDPNDLPAASATLTATPVLLCSLNRWPGPSPNIPRSIASIPLTKKRRSGFLVSIACTTSPRRPSRSFATC